MVEGVSVGQIVGRPENDAIERQEGFCQWDVQDRQPRSSSTSAMSAHVHSICVCCQHAPNISTKQELFILLPRLALQVEEVQAASGEEQPAAEAEEGSEEPAVDAAALAAQEQAELDWCVLPPLLLASCACHRYESAPLLLKKGWFVWIDQHGAQRVALQKPGF